MYDFLAHRIHGGHMTIDDVPKAYQKKIRQAYKNLYGEDLA